MEVEATKNPLVRTPPPQHLAELRMETAQSPVGFSSPCDACGSRKRRCLLPTFSPRKKMLLELAPFSSSSPPESPTPSAALERAASDSSAVSSALARTNSAGGSGGSLLSALLASPEQALPLTSSSRVVLSAPPAAAGPAIADSSPIVLLASPAPTRLARAGSRNGSWNYGVSSPLFVFSAPALKPPARAKSRGSDDTRLRRQLRLAAARRRSLRQCVAEQQVASLPQEAAKVNDTLPADKASRSSSSPSKWSARPCCTFLTSPARPCSGEKANKPESAVEVSSVTEEGPTSPPAAACRKAEVVVRVTCMCGAKKEFSFDHSH